MLVLTRRLGESIIIDGNICLTVTEVKGERVRIGIEAPPHVAVDRQEVHQRRRQFAEALEQRVHVLASASTNGLNGHCSAV